MMFELLLKVTKSSACEIPTLNTPSPVANLFRLAILHSKFSPSNLRIGGRPCTNHTVPYGTALGEALSQAQKKKSRRDSLIVAWHEVLGKASSRENRPVGYGMIGRCYPRGFSRRHVRHVSLGG